MAVQLSLGSNVGARRENLEAALAALGQLPETTLTRRSRIYETEPYGVTEQPAFLNMAVEIETGLQPLELLDAIKAIEHRLGRQRTEPWGPRKIDIDIVLWGDSVLETDRLTVPHPDYRRRAFVLIPLAEIAPEAVDPITGMTVAQLVAQPELQGRVRNLDTGD
ncbi:MAG: 2-amino-4-hydroxy-6-hydroxymethyldihydropteridine diphosphokinase [Candidatus Hydrogenedentota bacterium]